MKVIIDIEIEPKSKEQASTQRNLIEAVATQVFGGSKEGEVKAAKGKATFKVGK